MQWANVQYVRTPYSIEDQFYRHIRTKTLTIDIYTVLEPCTHALYYTIRICTLKHVRIDKNSTLPSAIGHGIEHCNLLGYFPRCIPFVPFVVRFQVQDNNYSIVCHISYRFCQL